MVKAILRYGCLVIPLAWYATFSTGCIPPIDLLSLSPSGRYLSVVDAEAAQFWIWDAEEGKAVDCPWEISQDVIACRFLSERKLLVLLAKEGEGEDNCDVYVVHWRSGRAYKAGETKDLNGFSYGVWKDKRFYCRAPQPQEDGKDGYVCKEIWLAWPHWTRDLFTSAEDIAWPSPSPSGQYVLACVGDAGKGLCLYDRTAKRLRQVLPAESAVAWSTWVDDRRFLYVLGAESNVPISEQQSPYYATTGDEIGALMLADIHCGESKRLLPCVVILDPPSFYPSTNEAIVTAYDPESIKATGGTDEVPPQVYAVNVDTGKSRRLTEPPQAAGFAVVSAKGSRVAFLSASMDDKENFKAMVLDLATGKITEPTPPDSLEEARKVHAAKNKPFEIRIGGGS